MNDPIEVLVYRGDMIESRHTVHAVICDPLGNTIAHAGQPGMCTYWRSSAKPIQALSFVAAGGAQAFGLGPADIAVICASHDGEPFHVKQVEHILQAAGFDEAALKCGVHPPLHGPSARALAERGEAPRAVHNNCSGKHAGMLAYTKLIGADPATYLDPSHPVQQRILATVEEFTGVERARIGIGVDGCGVPVFGLPLTAMATAFARLASGEGIDRAYVDPARSVVVAMQAHPEMVAGTEGICTHLMARLAPAIVAKGGAEGVYCIGHTTSKWGLAVKVEDGASRARPPAVVEILHGLMAIGPEEERALDGHRRPIIRNHAETVVGRLEARLPQDFKDALRELQGKDRDVIGRHTD